MQQNYDIPEDVSRNLDAASYGRGGSSNSPDFSGLPGHIVQSKSGETLLVDPITGKVIANYGSVGASGRHTTSSSSHYGVSELGPGHLAILQDQQRATEQKNAADEAYRRAELALAQGKADEAKREFDIAHSLDKARLSLNQSQFENNRAEGEGRLALDVYKNQQEVASNPRNWLLNFFQSRGATPPPGAEGAGNTPYAPGSVKNLQNASTPFAEFMKNFSQSLRGLYSQGAQVQPGNSVPGQAAVNAAQEAGPTQYANKAIPVGPGGSISDWARAHGYSADTSAPGSAASESLNQAGKSMQNGQEIWTGGPYSGQPVSAHSDFSGDLTPYQQPKQFKRGGSLKMMGPHALVDLMSGNVKAIGGEAGPEDVTFHGKAILVDDATKGTAMDPVVTPTGPADPVTGLAPTSQSPQYGPPAPTGASAADTNSAGITPEQMAALRAEAAQRAAAVNAANAARNATPPPPPPSSTPVPPPPPSRPAADNSTIRTPIQQQTQQPAGPGSGIGTTSITPPAPPPPPPAPAAFSSLPNVQQVMNSFAPASGPVTPPNGPTKFGGAGGGESSFNPENDAAVGSNEILDYLRTGQAVPPFLQRILQQMRGNKDFGTNVPQAYKLPGGAPLLSNMALQQMSPSEQQAFRAYLSALGVDWNDYIQQVHNASPSIEKASARPKLPIFDFFRQ